MNRAISIILSLVLATSIFGQSITVDTGTSYQTMRGWEATAEAGHSFVFPAETATYPSSSFANYKDDLLAAMLDVGINRIRLEWRMDDSNASGYTIDSPFPNATDPTVGTIYFDRYHQAMDAWGTEYRNMLAAQGESLFITMCIVDFRTGGFQAELTPSKYAFAVAAVMQDFYTTYGYLPDAIEPILEPDNASSNASTWTAARVAANIVAARASLAALDSGGSPGYGNIPFIAPSVTVVDNATSFLGSMISAEPSVEAMMSSYSYHRYGGDNTDVANLWTLASGDGKETGMTEYIGANHELLYDDLTIGHNSFWQQFTIAFPYTGWSDVGAEYFEVNTSTWAVSLNQRTKYLRHYFKYVRRGAVRKGVTNSGGTFLGVPFQNTNGTVVVPMKATGAGTVNVTGLPNGTYGRCVTIGNGSSAPSTYDSCSSNVTVTSPSDNVAVTFSGAGVGTVYDINYLAQSSGSSASIKLKGARLKGVRLQ